MRRAGPGSGQSYCECAWLDTTNVSSAVGAAGSAKVSTVVAAAAPLPCSRAGGWRSNGAPTVTDTYCTGGAEATLFSELALVRLAMVLALAFATATVLPLDRLP